MKPQPTENLRAENVTSPEVAIDGQVWLREILRNSKPKYVYAIEDGKRLQQVRKAISENEIAFLNPEEEKIDEQVIIHNIKKQKQRDLQNACPNQVKKFLKERR